MMSKKGPSTGKGANGTLAGDRGSQVLSQDAVRLFKTQDLGYVRTMRNKTAKEVDILKRQVIGVRSEGKRIVFVDDEEEQLEKLGGAGDSEDEEEDDDDDDEVVADEDADARQLRKLQAKEMQKLETRLEAAQERLSALTQAEEALDLQRARMAKSPAVGGVNKNGVKFKIRERRS
jgi:U3 small nucleolar RNA-associated protein 11